MLPDYWQAFLQKHNLVGRGLEVPEEHDQTEMGIEIIVYDDDKAREEAEEFYPGIAVLEDGFVPVGACALGSGDPYFINLNDGQGGPLYRVYHDSVSEDGYNREDAVVVVLENAEDLAKYTDS